jgi:hypothetical protein
MNAVGDELPRVARQRRRGPVFAFGALFALVIALQFSSVIGLLGYRLTGSFAWSFIGVARDALVLILAALVLLQSALSHRGKRWSNSVRWAVLVMVGLLGAALASTAEPAVLALNLRRLLLFPLLCLAVASCRLTEGQIDSLFRLIVGTTVLISLLGIIEYLAPNSLWRDYLLVVEYFSSNPLDPFGSLPFEESGRFFTWDLRAVFGGPIRRAVSTYLEPTTFAAALMCGACLLAASRHAREPGARWKLSVVAICGVLTISKGLALAMAAVALYRYTGLPSPRHLFLITLLGGSVALGLHRADLLEVGPMSHVTGLATSIEYVLDGNLLGTGLGNAGNYAAEGSDMEIGAESGLGNLIAQLGALALIYIVWIQSLANDVLRKARQFRSHTGLFLGALVMAWYVTFLFSASSMGIGGNALSFLAVSLYLHRNYKPIS